MGYRNGWMIRTGEDAFRGDKEREEQRKKAREEMRQRMEGEFRRGSYKGDEFSKEDYEAGYCDGFAEAMRKVKEEGERSGMMRTGESGSAYGARAEEGMRDGLGTNTEKVMYRNSRYGD